MPRPRVLQILSQRPSLTGSGVTLDALARAASRRGWEQRVIVGVPAGESRPRVADLPPESIHAVKFDAEGGAGPGADLPFAVPGMSDAMPYVSTRFRDLSPPDIERYESCWREAIRAAVRTFEPDVVHAHHAWVVSSLAAAEIDSAPVIVHLHGTGLRQLRTLPEWFGRIHPGLARVRRFVALTRTQVDDYAEALQLPADRFAVVGAGYREDLFHSGEKPQSPRGATILFAGKLSDAKGLGPLLDAVELLVTAGRDVELRVAGDGAGVEAERLSARIEALSPHARRLGRLSQAELAREMRRSAVFVLPSLYEGLPLVLIEALASGCRLVSTSLPGIVEGIAPVVGDALELVPLPPLAGVDQLAERDRPAFAANLSRALERTLDRGGFDDAAALVDRLEPFTWDAVFERVESVWKCSAALPDETHTKSVNEQDEESD